MGGSSNYHWNGDGAFEGVEEEVWERLVRVALHFQLACQTAVSKPNPRPYTPTAKGEPPRVRIGFGRDNILPDLDRKNLVARVGVGVNAIYMMFQELSLRLNHPWLLKTLDRVGPQLRAIAESGKTS